MHVHMAVAHHAALQTGPAAHPEHGRGYGKFIVGVESPCANHGVTLDMFHACKCNNYVQNSRPVSKYHAAAEVAAAVTAAMLPWPCPERD